MRLCRTPRITQPVRGRPMSMTCLRDDAVTVARHLLGPLSLYGHSVGSRKSFEIFGGLDGQWWEKRLLCCSLSRTSMPALKPQSSSAERRRKSGTPKMNSWHVTFLWRLNDVSNSATTSSSRPGSVSLGQRWQIEQAASFSLACQRAKIIQTRRGWLRARQQPDFLLLIGRCGDSL